ncbi:MAG: helix-turn-helix domain-containing protein [Bacteroidota bacterium]
MKLHIGEKIKERAKELRMGPTELAKLISTSKQNVYGIFKRESIDCSLLQKFCKALNYDFFSHYNNSKLPPHTELSTKKSKAYPFSENDTLNNQLMDLKEKYELLKKVNTLLEEKKK